MRKFYLLTISILGFQLVEAQIIFESSDFASNGELYPVINIADPTSFDFAQTGADYFWDYEGMLEGESEDYGYEDPNNSPFKNIWCLFHFYITNCNTKFNEEFNMGITMNMELDMGGFSFDNPYQHLQKTNTELSSKMLAANIEMDGSTIPAFLEYTDPDVLFKFPMNYNDSYTDTNSISMDFSPLGMDITVDASGTRTNTVEGWGNLNIRGYTFENVLKVKSVLDQDFEVEMDGETTDFSMQLISYFWFSKDYGIPVLMVNGTEIEDEFIPATITYVKNELMSATDIKSDKFSIYPNPTDGKINVKLPAGEEIISVQIFDTNGRIVEKRLNLSSLNSGIYTLKIQTNNRIITQKIIRK